jgi:hypothetical protein
VKLPYSPSGGAAAARGYQLTVPALSSMGGAAASGGGFARGGTAATTAPAAWQQTGEVILAVSSPRTPVSPPPAHLLSGSTTKTTNGTGSYRRGETGGFDDGRGLRRKVKISSPFQNLLYF